MIVFVVIFLLWLLIGLGCGLPGASLPSRMKTDTYRVVEMQITSV